MSLKTIVGRLHQRSPFPSGRPLHDCPCPRYRHEARNARGLVYFSADSGYFLYSIHPVLSI